MSRSRAFDTPSFVGRQVELQLAASVLWPRGGIPQRSVVVAGEAGVGKTRLALEVAELARARGHTVTTIRVTPAMAAVPLGAWSSVVAVGDARHERRADLLSGAADALAADPQHVWIVDDAHRLDAASAGALHLAMSRATQPAPFRAVLTIRSGETVDAAVVALWKDELAERIDLAPLARHETEELAAAMLGAPLDGVSASDLWESSTGNALFVRELLVGALDQGLLVRQGDVHRFTARPRTSARLAELLGARLSGLPPDELEVLDVLAVAGSVGLDQLRSVGGDEPIDRLERRGLLSITTDGRRMPVRLVHPLYEELLRARMGRMRELAVHRLLAEQLEGFGARRRNDLLDLARWRLVCGGNTQPDLILRAAGQALARFDAELAGDLARLARSGGAGGDADLLEAQAFAQQGRNDEAAAVFRRALRDATSDEAVVWAATELSVIQFWTLHDEALAAQTIEDAVERVTDPACERRLRAHATTFVAMGNRPAEALAAAQPYLDEGDGPEYLVAAVAIGPTLTVAGRANDALELAEQCLPVRLAVGDAAAIPDAFKYTISKVFALSEVGRLNEATQLVTDTYELAAAMRSVPGVAWAAMLRGRTALVSGDLATASIRFGEAAELFDELCEQGLRSWCLAGTVLSAAMAGDDERAAARCRELAEVDPGPVRLMQADLDRAVAWARRVAGDVRGAHRVLEAAVADADMRGAHGMSLAMIHDLVRFGDQPAGDLLRADHHGVQGALAAARRDMVAAHAADDGDLLDDVASEFARLGALLFAAEASAAATAAHRRAGEPRRAANSLRMSDEHRERCTTVATPLLAPASVVARLTERERQVAELAAAGLSSRAIAAQLERSVRTVENHLQRVYDKLGVTGRSSLASALGRAGDRGD